jgi:hypothetical protein
LTGLIADVIFRDSAGVAAFAIGLRMVNVFLKSISGFGRVCVTVFGVIVTVWAVLIDTNNTIEARTSVLSFMRMTG